MEQDVELNLLREEVGLLGPRTPSRRYPEELKRRLMRWAQARREAGASAGEVAEALGIPWESLRKWGLAGFGASAPEGLRPVEVVSGTSAVRPTPRSQPPAAAHSGPQAAVVLRTPRGFTVELPDVATLVDVLARLG